VSAKPSQAPPAAHPGERDPQKENLIYAATYYPGTLDKSRAIPVLVHSGEESAANFGPLTTHAYRVTGTVSGAPSAAITQLVLYSTGGAGTTDRPQQLSDGGRFEVQNLLPGTYTAMMMVVRGLLGGEQPQIQILRLTPSIDVDNANVDGVQLQGREVVEAVHDHRPVAPARRLPAQGIERRHRALLLVTAADPAQGRLVALVHSRHRNGRRRGARAAVRRSLEEVIAR